MYSCPCFWHVILYMIVITRQLYWRISIMLMVMTAQQHDWMQPCNPYPRKLEVRRRNHSYCMYYIYNSSNLKQERIRHGRLLQTEKKPREASGWSCQVQRARGALTGWAGQGREREREREKLSPPEELRSRPRPQAGPKTTTTRSRQRESVQYWTYEWLCTVTLHLYGVRFL